MSVPTMTYTESPVVTAFSPPMMGTTNRQVYELPQQQGPTSGLAVDTSLLSGGLGVLDGVSTGSQGYTSYYTGGPPQVPSPLGSPGAPFTRLRSMSCASQQSDVSSNPVSFRHNPYGDEDGWNNRTPSPMGVSPVSPASFPSFPSLESGANLEYSYPAPPIQTGEIRPIDTATNSSDENTPLKPTKEQKAPKPKEGKKAVSAMLVKFKHGREGEYYSDISRKPGTHVVIEGQRGQDLGIVSSCHIVDNKPRAERRRRRVRRDATDEEIHAWNTTLLAEEETALSLMKQHAIKHKIPIVVHRAEFQFDRKKLTFHYTTKVAKPDFRSILHDGFRQFKCRIWMNNCDPRSSEPGDKINLNSSLLPSF
eukprot:TRINITY_DN10968_c0_g1_i1.p1 TRINITY_DN10968_c0_g1~~TRINITY_DN10968_c0_g1_i1.p1  ORF type:complete len:365 (+),score=68.22 TRINITY_DN10968_c0_g1_i1:112-1206(+)